MSTKHFVIHKYGGSSVGSIERIRNIAQRIRKWYVAGYKIVVVCSAMGGETDRLLTLAEQITTNPHLRELDMLAATGEQVSISLLALALHELNVPAQSYTGWQIGIRTNTLHGKARILSIDHQKIIYEAGKNQVVIIAGFQGVDTQQKITTLGRGGSDISAVALAAALKMKECFIYTDVDGVYTADPHVVKSAKSLPRITFEEMLEMASLGAKILQIRAVGFAIQYGVNVRVLSSLTDPNLPLEIEKNSGTLITQAEECMESTVISSISCSRNETKICVFGMDNRADTTWQVLDAIAKAHIEFDMVSQHLINEAQMNLSLTVPRRYSQAVLLLLQPLRETIKAQSITTNSQVAKISIVGLGLRSNPSVISTIFRVLAEKNINPQLVSTSEIRASILIEEKVMEIAVIALHQAFDLGVSSSAYAQQSS